MIFFCGVHMLAQAWKVDPCMVSVTRLRDRKSDFPVRTWLLDSGAFSELAQYGGYRHDASEYASQIQRWSRCGNLLAAVAQDYMCEPFMLARTGLDVATHQRLTIERYDALAGHTLPVPVVPVLQGYAPAEYVQHIHDYGERLIPGMWVGVGSVCKRNSTPDAVEAVLSAIHHIRPDLRLHGFGIKVTALRRVLVNQLLYSADSMAWSFAARREGSDANSAEVANVYTERVMAEAGTVPSQLALLTD